MGHCASGAAAATIRSMPFCIPVLLSRRICAFMYSPDFLSNEKFPANKPKQPTLVDYALGSPCRVPPGSETGQQDSDSGRTVTTVIRQPLTKVLGEESLSVSRFQSLLLFAFKILVSQAISLFSFIFHFLSPFRFYILQSIVGRRWGQRTTLRGEVRGPPSGVSSFPPLWNLGTELRLTWQALLAAPH